MQGVLCLIFIASLGLAALVTHERKLQGNTRLAGIRYAGSIGVKLPAGWALERENQGNILFVASEPDTPEKKGRTLTVRKHKVDPTQSSEEFLQSSGLLRGTLRLVATDPNANLALPITIADQPGVMLAVKKPLGFLFLPTTDYETNWFAASVRPSGLALSLQLECPDDSDPEEDRQTLTEIAAAIVVHGD